MTPDFFDNRSRILKDDMAQRLRSGDRISIAAAYFSIYGFQELRRELEACGEFRFIYTEPTFLSSKADKEQREFYIPRLNRERSLYGTEFEIKLRNELTQRAIARECADWMRAKARFKSFSSPQAMQTFFEVEGDGESYVYMPFEGLTTTGLGTKPGATTYTMINRLDAPVSQSYLELFDRAWEDGANLQDVTDEVIDSISNVYRENAPETIYYLALFNIFNEFLEDISEDVLPNEATGYRGSVIWSKLYDFQCDAAVSIINKLETYSGCILADSVGLGKTFTALAVIKYYESRNRNVLVLCPKKLKDKSDAIDGLVLRGSNLDEAWDSIVAQVALGSEDGRDVDGRIAVRKRRAELEKEIAALDAKCRKERQISKRNELFEMLRSKEAELEALGKGE